MTKSHTLKIDPPMKKTKTSAQLNRMKFRNQINFFSDLFVTFCGERRLMVSSANELFATSEPIPEFDGLAGNFRVWALTQYPKSAERIDSALHNARIQYFEGKDEPSEAALQAEKFAREAQAIKAGWLQSVIGEYS